MIIDGHVHIWELPPIAPVGPTAPSWTGVHDEPGSLELLADDLDANGVAGAALVQSSGATWDNAYIARAANSDRRRFRAIGLLDPLDPNNAVHAENWMTQWQVDGFRFHPDYYAECDILTLPTNRRLWETLERRSAIVKVHNRVGNARQLGTVAPRYPGIRWVIDHMMYPEPGMASPSATRGPYAAVLELAANANVYMMVSDVHNRSAAAYPHADMHDLVKAAIDAFGIDRCLWGTGYPGHHRVAAGWPTLAEELRLVREGFDWLTAAEREQLLSGTAARLYGYDGAD